MSNEGKRYQLFTRRAVMLGGGQALLFSALAGRMYYLGVVESGQYQMLAEENRVSRLYFAPPRGVVQDRFGREIAGNRRDFRVFLIPEQVKDMERTIGALRDILDLSDGAVERIQRQIRRQRSFFPATVAENLSWQQFARVNVESSRLEGVLPDAGETRFYANGLAAAHVVGYVGAVTEDDQGNDRLLRLPGVKIGRTGLERSYDQMLRGSVGSRRVEVNAYGRVIRELSRQDGDPGRDLQLTLDMELQQFVVDTLKENSAAVVVMDAHKGDVLALASSPAFDPNDFNRGISTTNYSGLLKDPRKPLINKCVAGQYPPGSTFKMVVALAALEAGTLTKDTKYFCNGKHILGDSTFHCWKRGGHGWLQMTDAIAQSCDVFFYNVAQELGIDRMGAMAIRLGFGQSYDIGLTSEANGLVPSPEWKQNLFNERWHLGETVIVGIGQGALLATPLQLAVMVARLANGGMAVRPRLVRSVGDTVLPDPEFASLGLDPEDLAMVQQAMVKVLQQGGTAFRSRLRDEGMSMAGKTGTSQVRRITKAEREADADDMNALRAWQERDHALFVGYGPVESPRYALSLLVEHGGGGSSVAAPLARDIMRRTLELDPLHRPIVAGVRRPTSPAGQL